MAAKVKIGDHVCTIKSGVWSCPEQPELAAFVQAAHDDYFADPKEYVVDIDEQGAKFAVRRFKAKILEVTAPEPDDPGAVVF